MDNVARKNFWDTLNQLNGVDMDIDIQKLNKTIIFPCNIYRYRAINTSTIDALQTNTLFFSTANYYDDPFDTNINVDFNKIRNQATDFFNLPNLEKLFPEMCDALNMQFFKEKGSSMLKNYTRAEMVQGLEMYLKNLNIFIQQNLKQNIWSACFSESGLNETMWLKYADQYKGFCLIYSLDNFDETFLCGKQEKCNKCDMGKCKFSLYPMYYSDEKYDATLYAGTIWFNYICQNYLPPNVADVCINKLQLRQCPWDNLRISLIKSKCHEYDKEWRAIYNGVNSNHIFCKWIPKGIILGLRTSENDKNLLIRSAQLSGIQHIYELYITEQYELDKREINM